MDWHHLIYKTYVCLLQPFPLVQLSALRLVEISCCLAPVTAPYKLSYYYYYYYYYHRKR